MHARTDKEFCMGVDEVKKIADAEWDAEFL